MTVLDQFRLDGQVAVITGGGRGIGEAIAIGMAEAGADIVVAARRTDEIEAVADKVRALGRRAMAVTTDMMEIDQVQALAEKCSKDMGGLTCWVSNAGGADGSGAENFFGNARTTVGLSIKSQLKSSLDGCSSRGKYNEREWRWFNN